MLPLTIDEAVARADRFPLALVWTPVRKGAPSYARMKRLGLEVTLGKGRTVAVLVSPMVYLPPSFSCPDLTAEGRCAVHGTPDKPLRCRAMPFDPRRAEADQQDLLLPRAGWTCDISANAPEVYQDGMIADPSAYVAEREALLAQAPVMRAYAKSRLTLSPMVLRELDLIDRKKGYTGTVALSFTALLPRLPEVDADAFVRGQRAVLADCLSRTAPKGDQAPFHRFYREVLDNLGPAKDGDDPSQ